MFSLYSRCFSIRGCHSLVLHFWPPGDTVRWGFGGGCGTRGRWSWRLQCRREGLAIRSLQADEVVAVESSPVSSYRLGVWLRLWGWSCRRFCCSCTASCCDWSDVESLLINADTQFAGMISPVRKNQSCYLKGFKSLVIFWKAETGKPRWSMSQGSFYISYVNRTSLLDSQ